MKPRLPVQGHGKLKSPAQRSMDSGGCRRRLPPRSSSSSPASWPTIPTGSANLWPMNCQACARPGGVTTGSCSPSTSKSTISTWTVSSTVQTSTDRADAYTGARCAIGIGLRLRGVLRPDASSSHSSWQDSAVTIRFADPDPMILRETVSIEDSDEDLPETTWTLGQILTPESRLRSETVKSCRVPCLLLAYGQTCQGRSWHSKRGRGSEKGLCVMAVPRTRGRPKRPTEEVLLHGGFCR